MPPPAQRKGVLSMKRYLHFLRQAFLYGVIGACSSGLDAVLFAVLCGPLAWNPYVANVLSVHCGIFCTCLSEQPSCLRRSLLFLQLAIIISIFQFCVLYAYIVGKCCDLQDLHLVGLHALHLSYQLRK